MKIVYKSPEKYPNIFNNGRSIVFLAGSIDQGSAKDWQTIVTDYLIKEYNDSVLILNPRRDDWDSSWEETITNKKFKEQVDWELKGMEDADLIIMNFEKDSKSPITLLELGLNVNSQIVVCCPDGFYRKGNIEVVCDRYNIPLYNTLDELLKIL